MVIKNNKDSKQQQTTVYKKEQRLKEIVSFFLYHLAAAGLTLAHYWVEIVTHPMLITMCIQVSTRRLSGTS